MERAVKNKMTVESGQFYLAFIASTFSITFASRGSVLRSERTVGHLTNIEVYLFLELCHFKTLWNRPIFGKEKFLPFGSEIAVLIAVLSQDLTKLLPKLLKLSLICPMNQKSGRKTVYLSFSLPQTPHRFVGFRYGRSQFYSVFLHPLIAISSAASVNSLMSARRLAS